MGVGEEEPIKKKSRRIDVNTTPISCHVPAGQVPCDGS